MKTVVLLVMIMVSILGIADASYISWQKFSGYLPPCQPPFKCEAVLNSPWANIGPIPIAVLGIGFYSTMLLLTISLYLGVTKIHIGRLKLPLLTALLAWGIFGALFSLYLITIMGVILQAWCVYCVISAVNCAVLGTLSIVLYRSQPKEILNES